MPDIRIKGSRAGANGVKRNLTTGRSGSLLEPVIGAGNPAARARLAPRAEHHCTRGRAAAARDEPRLAVLLSQEDRTPFGIGAALLYVILGPALVAVITVAGCADDLVAAALTRPQPPLPA